MPIKREHHFLYPIDWPQLSRLVRFERARGRCERYGRPHGEVVQQLPDGRWWDRAAGCWRSATGRALRHPRVMKTSAVEIEAARAVRVVLAAAHLDHDPTNNRLGKRSANVAIWSMIEPTTGPGAGLRSECAMPRVTCSTASLELRRRKPLVPRANCQTRSRLPCPPS
jgi:hypothetical protein